MRLYLPLTIFIVISSVTDTVELPKLKALRLPLTVIFQPKRQVWSITSITGKIS